MDALEICVVFFGLPVMILGLGMRRAVGTARMLSLLLLSTGVGLYGLLAETVSAALGAALPLPSYGSWSQARVLLPLCVGASFLGALGVVLVRCRPRGGGL